MEEIYICTDIEADGPCPGHYSMLSFASVAFRLDKTILGAFERNLELLPGAQQYKPTMDWWKTEPEAWAACRKDPVDPKEAMTEYVEWVKGLDGLPVFVAAPVSFDWSFILWYLYELAGENPFHPIGLDVNSYAMAVMKKPYSQCMKDDMPKEWTDEKYEHTHVAMDDALGHAMRFCNMVAQNTGTEN